MKHVLTLTAVTLLAALSGCGGGPAVASGKVTFRGRVVTSGSVIIVQADGSARSGVILPDGTFKVEGLKRGPVKVAVLSPDPAHARSILKAEGDRGKNAPTRGKRAAATKSAPTGWFPLPAKFGDPDKSGLGCDIAAARVEHDIAMQ